MASDFDKVMKKIVIDIREAANELISKSNLQKFAEKYAERVRVRTRLQYGVKKTGAPRERLAKLKTSTVKVRERLKKKGELSEFTTPKRSNLTRTGQMLESLQGKVPRAGLIEINPAGNRRDDDLSNQEVSDYVQEATPNRAARPYLTLSDIELDALKQDMAKSFLSILNKRLK